MAINVDKSDRSPFGMKLTIRLFSDQWDKSFGPGLAELLEQVDGCGSLRVATATMEISYSKAWCLLGDCERALGFLLLDRTVGGQHGGSSHLTPQGRALLDRYRLLEQRMAETGAHLLDELFAEFMPGTQPGDAVPEEGGLTADAAASYSSDR